MCVVRSMSVGRAKKLRKIYVGSLQNRPRSPPRPSKIEPVAAISSKKNDQHEFKKCKKRLRTGQERKENAQERKMCQHEPNMSADPPDFGRSWPPLVRTCSMLMQAKNAVGFDTPGAASSAADLESQDAPKSWPKPEQIDVKKQHVFDIDFGRVRLSFWKGFW